MATGQDTFSEVLASDLRDLISQIKATALPGSGYFMHRTTWGIVQKIQQNSNFVVALQNPMITPASAAAINPNLLPVGTIWGYPVYLSDQIVSTTAVSTKFIAFGNLKYAWFGDRAAMTMKISDSATVGSNNVFAENESAVRFTERVAIAVGLPSAFAVLKTAAS
jgi:HK97 family phage major capsid protein